VICTGHGPATIGVDRSSRSHKAPADKARPPCGFAGNVLADLADAPHPFASRAVAFAAPASGFAVEPDPGRGLAAPPPPSQGPPVLL
jgi:hypothetical protein